MKPKNTAQEEIKVYIFRPYIPGVDTDGDEERIYAKSLEQAQLQISKQVYYRDLDPKYRVEYYTLIGIYPKDPNKAYGLDPFYHELCEHPPGSLWPPESGIRPYMPVKLGEARYRRYYLIWKELKLLKKANGDSTGESKLQKAFEREEAAINTRKGDSPEKSFDELMKEVNSLMINAHPGLKQILDGEPPPRQIPVEKRT
jgi:hypothetical protein